MVRTLVGWLNIALKAIDIQLALKGLEATLLEEARQDITDKGFWIVYLEARASW